MAKEHPTKDQTKDKSMIDPQRIGTSPLASLLVSFYRIWHGALKLKGAGYMLGKLAPVYGSLQSYPIRLHEGQAVALDFRDISAFCWLNYTLGEEFEETGLLKAMSSVIQPDSVVWDVGANCGKVSYLLARHTPAQKVIFFEPIKSMFEITASALSPFTNVSGHNVALSDKTTQRDLMIPHRNSTMATLDTDSPEQGGLKIRVSCVKGDDIVANRGAPAPSVIKIDTEGHEPRVFAGLADTIRIHRPSIFFEHLSVSDEEIRTLIPRDYEIFTVSSREGNLIKGFQREVGHNSALFPKRN